MKIMHMHNKCFCVFLKMWNLKESQIFKPVIRLVSPVNRGSDPQLAQD